MKQGKLFSYKDSMLDLVKEDFNILPILSRFGVPLGFGGGSIEEICLEKNINVEIFLLIVNYILNRKINYREASLEKTVGIVDFLHNSHDYFLDYKFPHIRENLLKALDENHEEINPSIINFFDSYVDEVRKHFKHEENHLFPYIRRFGQEVTDYSIDVFSKQHDKVGEKLSDLKNIILRYYRTSKPNRMYDALVDIFNCEEDLNTHTDIEDNILVPMMRQLEKESGNIHKDRK
ncbi:MAG: hemerythrin domain-containing protein [Paramuribaculum sp.]|nr:hemerythrin domain-containing protein [Paramuribaculum sp.]